MSRSRRISIVEKDFFVSQDIRDAFQTALPMTSCDIFQSVGEVRASDVVPDLIVVSANSDGRIEASDQDVLWLMDRSVIAIDPQLTQLPAGWAHLNKPFTEEQLIAAAANLLDGPDRMQ